MTLDFVAPYVMSAMGGDFRRYVDIHLGAAGRVIGWRLTENGPKQVLCLHESTELAGVI